MTRLFQIVEKVTNPNYEKDPEYEPKFIKKTCSIAFSNGDNRIRWYNLEIAFLSNYLPDDLEIESDYPGKEILSLKDLKEVIN